MVFTSTVFLFLFLPLFLTVFYLLPQRFRMGWVLLGSYAFYGWWRLDFLALLAGTTLLTWTMGRLLRERDAAPRRARAALAVGVVGNLATLAYFKYADFGIESLNALLTALGGGELRLASVLLPVGISFYVFQSVSYLVDVWRGDAPGDRGLVTVAAYIALFPQLIAGPIVRFKSIAEQLRTPGGDFADVSAGAQRFMVGFCKKVLIADTVAPIADAAFAVSSPSMADAWLGVLAYAVQLFFDFSGYSDMAIGLGRMMGFRFLENFDRPYLATSITDFWRRWHISLSRWLRDYLYIPLGGNRKGRGRTYVNLMTVMVLGGLWHGAAWTFVVWGAWHGALLATERWLEERGTPRRLPRELAGLRTFVWVLIGWAFFRAGSVGAAFELLGGMVGRYGVAPSAELTWQVSALAGAALIAAALIVWLPPLLRRAPNADDELRPAGDLAPLRFAVAPLFVLGVLQTVARSTTPFLYFQF